MTHAILDLIFIILLIPGIGLIFLPFPGVPYMFVMALLYGLFDHFTHLSLLGLGILAGLTVFSLIVDNLAGLLGAKYGGARGRSLLYGFIGMIIGAVFVPFIGGLIGLFLGIFIGESLRNRTTDQALKAAATGVIGTVTGMIINCLVAILFFILFLFFIF